MSKTHDEANAAAFAADPSAWGDPKRVLTGRDAARCGRSVLEAAGVDVAAVERAVGRPRLGGGTGVKGVRSPRLNVTISAEQAAELQRREGPGTTRSDIVRAALDAYFKAS